MSEPSVVLVGQVRQNPETKNIWVVMWIEGQHVLAGRNSNPIDNAWFDIEKVRTWTFMRRRTPAGTSGLQQGDLDG